MTASCSMYVAPEKSSAIKNVFPYSKDNFEKVYTDFKKWIQQEHILYEQIIPGSELDNRRREKNLSNPRTNETSKVANDYRMLAMDFKSRNKAAFSAFKETHANLSTMQPNGEMKATDEVQNALETIGWYELQIPVKITQAYLSLAQQKETERNSVQTEFNGSAKIVLIEIETSFQAWNILIQHFPAFEQACRNAMYQLDRIYQRIFLDFPNAKDFIRPGFDQLVHQ